MSDILITKQQMILDIHNAYSVVMDKYINSKSLAEREMYQADRKRLEKQYERLINNGKEVSDENS